MRYYKRKGSDIVEELLSDRTAIPNTKWTKEQMDKHGFEEVEKEPEPVYNAAEFKLAIIADPLLSPLLMKAPAALIDGINAGNWGVVKAGIDYMVSNGTATQGEYDKFIEVLIENNGPDLNQGD